MKISLNSIKQLVPVTIPEEKLNEVLTSHLCNIEHIEDLSKKYTGIIVAEIVSAEVHPSADKLGVYQVNIGTGNPVQVVAGDKSLKTGDKVAYFAPGIKVPFNAHPEKSDGIVQEVELRGVRSQGMLASAKELDFSNNHEQVIVLDTDKPVGTLLAEAYGLNDMIIDIENKGLTNRPECFGLIGLAREFAGIQGVRFQTPEWFDYTKTDWKTKFPISKVDPSVETLKLNAVNASPDLCPRYMCVALENIELRPSPVWLQVELSKAGVRPINNVVDVTNYLMILTGQPLHAFDYDKIADRAENVDEKEAGIVVRNAKAGEKITVIDGNQKDLDETMLVITDGVSPVAIAGVMGGLSSEISNETKKIILESASFDMYNIRKTSNKTGIKSDAVTRYARSQDPEQCQAVLLRAIEMLKHLSGASVASRIIDLYPRPRKTRSIEIELDRMNSKLGLNLTTEEVSKILNNVELENQYTTDRMTVTVPTYRQDLNIPEDIYEEVARLYGFEKIELTLPTRSTEAAKSNKSFELQNKIRKILSAAGATEAITYNFTSKNLIEKTGQDVKKAYRLINALSPELEYMRMSIVPSLLEKVSENMHDGFEEIAMFELNKTHIKGETVGKFGGLGVGIIPVEHENPDLPYEWRLCSLVISLSDRVATEKYAGSPYYMAKAYSDRLLTQLKVNGFEYESVAKLEGKELNTIPAWIVNDIGAFVKNESAVVSVTREGKKFYVGVVGTVDRKIRKALGLAECSAAFEMNLEELLLSSGDKSAYYEPSRYPKSSQDLCFVADMHLPYEMVTKTILAQIQTDSDLIAEIEPVDIYVPAGVTDLKQITIRLSIRSKSRVLKVEDIELLRKKIVDMVEKETGAKIKA